VEYRLARDERSAERMPGDTVSVLALFDDASGCEKFAQRLLRFEPGVSAERLDEADDEVLFVLEGSGTITAAGEDHAVAPGTGVFVGRSTSWSVTTDGGLELVSVLVRAPEPDGAGGCVVVDLEAEGRMAATASRQFVLGVRAETGCPSATQFIGFVPPGRAPDHFHRYDEVIYILEGRGLLHIGGEVAPLEPGACVHLPARLVHSLENVGDSELHLLGVFRPSGSPAEAYYPDGTPATYDEEPQVPRSEI
jgi:mannose-6-phosphate isomerase-like protein (cupin superfamily)